MFEEVKLLGAPEKIERRLTVVGKWSIGLAVFGILLAVSSEGITQRISKKRSEAAQAAASLQLSHANQMLAELRTQSLRAQDILGQLSRANSSIDRIRLTIHAQVSDTNEAVRLLLDRPHPTFPHGKPPSLTVINREDIRKMFPIQKGSSDADKCHAFFSFMQQPLVEMEFRKLGQNGYPHDPNLIFRPDEFESPKGLFCDLTERKLSAFWPVDSSRKHWRSDGEIFSVLDLGQSLLRVRVAHFNGDESSSIGLSIAMPFLQPGNFPFWSITNFARGSNENGIFYEAILPPAQELLKGGTWPPTIN